MYQHRGQNRAPVITTMLELLFIVASTSVGLVLLSPILVPVALIIGLAIAAFWIVIWAIGITTVTYMVSVACWKAFFWRIITTIIDLIPFLTERVRKAAHRRVNVFFGYSFYCHDFRKYVSPRPSIVPEDITNPNLMTGETSQQWLARNVSSTSVVSRPSDDYDVLDNWTWANEDDEAEALYMAKRRSAFMQPSFDGPSFAPRSRRASRADSTEVSRQHSRAPTPSSYTAFEESMRPPSRNGSGYFGGNSVRGPPMTPSGDTQNFQFVRPESPISLQGRRPSASAMTHRRNNMSTTSFGSVPEERAESKTTNTTTNGSTKK